jgi:hypothetical protein
MLELFRHYRTGMAAYEQLRCAKGVCCHRQIQAFNHTPLPYSTCITSRGTPVKC